MKRILIITAVLSIREIDLFAAEAGMPQLDPKYWASQGFWLILVFSILYVCISKFFIPKIKNNLSNRENKIKDDLEEAKNLRDMSEKKHNEYIKIIEGAKKEVSKIFIESKKKLDKDMQLKKKQIEGEIDLETKKAQKEIIQFKEESIDSMNKISQNITSRIIEDISGDKLNESSIKAAVSETFKNWNKHA